jgi:hypothetical protein
MLRPNCIYNNVEARSFLAAMQQSLTAILMVDAFRGVEEIGLTHKRYANIAVDIEFTLEGPALFGDAFTNTC